MFLGRSLLAQNMELEFEKYCKKNGKTFATDQEKQFRFKIFKDNYKLIQEDNLSQSGLNDGSKGSQAKPEYRSAVNKFADMTDDEFDNAYLMPLDKYKDTNSQKAIPSKQNGKGSQGKILATPVESGFFDSDILTGFFGLFIKFFFGPDKSSSSNSPSTGSLNNS